MVIVVGIIIVIMGIIAILLSLTPLARPEAVNQFGQCMQLARKAVDSFKVSWGRRASRTLWKLASFTPPCRPGTRSSTTWTWPNAKQSFLVLES